MRPYSQDFQSNDFGMLRKQRGAIYNNEKKRLSATILGNYCFGAVVYMAFDSGRICSKEGRMVLADNSIVDNFISVNCNCPCFGLKKSAPCFTRMLISVFCGCQYPCRWKICRYKALYSELAVLSLFLDLRGFVDPGL